MSLDHVTESDAFCIAVPDAVLTDLYRRLESARLPEATATEPWAAGVDPAYLGELVRYWRTDFDWRACERHLNSFQHYQTELAGRRVHYVHAAGKVVPGSPRPLPLILTHGWPSSFVEMLPLVPLLTDPASYGADADDAFDVVIPSLPGFGYSEVLAHDPITRPVVADLWARLMSDVLGYPRFGAYGGDIGGGVTNFLGARHPDKVVGIHTIHPCLPAPMPPQAALSPAEQAYLHRRDIEDETDGGYSAIQITRPDTIAAALIDSPSGLAAWLIDKYRAWGDCHGDIESRFSRDVLLTIITLYWVTDTIGSSFRPYYDYHLTPPNPQVTVPAGITLTTEDADYPRELAERSYTDIRHWRDATAGGHFLPLEEPEMLAAELRNFFRPLRKATTGFPQ